jgi:hypothetical protein
MKRINYPVILAIALIIASCATSGTGGTARRGNILPLSNGWYQYDSIRTLKGIENEQNFFNSTGMKMIQEISYEYNGVVSRFDDGVLFDPVLGMELLIDNHGKISCAENLSIRGTVKANGSFEWSGQSLGPAGDLNTIFVRGKITPLPPSARGGKEFDGVYHLTDTGTGRQQLVRISDGFYTWNYTDGQSAGFTPWPTLVQPDGSFVSTMEITTVMSMENISSMNYSTNFIFQGKLTPGAGITLEEFTESAGQGMDKTKSEPQVYSGSLMRSGEFPNEAIPANIESLVQAGRAAVRVSPKPNRIRYPQWYLNPPAKSGFIYGMGEKTFDVKETALSMAEAAASAYLLNQIMMQIQSTYIDIYTDKGTIVEDKTRSEAFSRLKYKVIEQTYDNDSRTAYVLLEMEDPYK